MDPQDPGKLLPEEEEVMNKLLLSFQQSEIETSHVVLDEERETLPSI